MEYYGKLFEKEDYTIPYICSHIVFPFLSRATPVMKRLPAGVLFIIHFKAKGTSLFQPLCPKAQRTTHTVYWFLMTRHCCHFTFELSSLQLCTVFTIHKGGLHCIELCFGYCISTFEFSSTTMHGFHKSQERSLCLG